MQCITCSDPKTIDDFRGFMSRGKKYYRKQCKVCVNAARTQQYANNIELQEKQKAKSRNRTAEQQARYVRRYRWRKYGIDPDLVEATLAEHDGNCGLCKEPIVGTICVDHDHMTNQFRDVLCNNCNAGLGQFKDSPRLLMLAIDYLAKHS